MILRGQDAGSTDTERKKATEQIAKLTNIVNQCLIRRTNSILTKYLPVKFEMVICVRMTDLQTQMYKSFLASDSLRKNILGKICLSSPSHMWFYVHFSFRFWKIDKNAGNVSLTALSSITNLKKLCNHPDLIYDKIEKRSDGFENAHKFLPDNYSKK